MSTSICGHRGHVILTLQVLGKPSSKKIVELRRDVAKSNDVKFTFKARESRAHNAQSITITVATVTKHGSMTLIIGKRGSGDLQRKHVLTYIEGRPGVCEVFNHAL